MKLGGGVRIRLKMWILGRSKDVLVFEKKGREEKFWR